MTSRSSGCGSTGPSADSRRAAAPAPPARVRPNRKKFSAPDFLANLDVGAVQRADGQRAVHPELHVAGAGGLLARG